ncbi:HMG box transcription factor BBX [Heterocephalus glaber]|uniref:HMG box transcription factor BBX n=1 Tax=Heterocephalus glaber TaxID=10181 RepID=G5AKH6_HETGA|nr:HMG box transcription factor BBX [Heterocephalus glaber]
MKGSNRNKDHSAEGEGAGNKPKRKCLQWHPLLAKKLLDFSEEEEEEDEEEDIDKVQLLGSDGLEQDVEMCLASEGVKMEETKLLKAKESDGGRIKELEKGKEEREIKVEKTDATGLQEEKEFEKPAKENKVRISSSVKEGILDAKPPKKKVKSREKKMSKEKSSDITKESGPPDSISISASKNISGEVPEGIKAEPLTPTEDAPPPSLSGQVKPEDNDYHRKTETCGSRKGGCWGEESWTFNQCGTSGNKKFKKTKLKEDSFIGSARLDEEFEKKFNSLPQHSPVTFDQKCVPVPRKKKTGNVSSELTKTSKDTFQSQKKNLFHKIVSKYKHKKEKPNVPEKGS